VSGDNPMQGIHGKFGRGEEVDGALYFGPAFGWPGFPFMITMDNEHTRLEQPLSRQQVRDLAACMIEAADTWMVEE